MGRGQGKIINNYGPSRTDPDANYWSLHGDNDPSPEESRIEQWLLECSRMRSDVDEFYRLGISTFTARWILPRTEENLESDEECQHLTDFLLKQDNVENAYVAPDSNSNRLFITAMIHGPQNQLMARKEARNTGKALAQEIPWQYMETWEPDDDFLYDPDNVDLVSPSTRKNVQE